jgi:hypothetical protein
LADTQERNPLLGKVVVDPPHQSSKMPGTSGGSYDKVVAYARDPGDVEDHRPLCFMIVENAGGPEGNFFIV